MLIVAIFSATALISCSSSDDEEKTTDEKLASQFQYTLTFSADILDIADVTVYYIDTDNNEKSETITSTTWTKTFSADKFNVSSGVIAAVKLKEGVTLDKESYDIEYSIGYNITSTKNGGIVDFKKSSTSAGMSNVAKDDVAMTMDGLNLEASFKVDDEGQVDFTTLSWQNNIITLSNLDIHLKYAHAITFSQDLLDVADIYVINTCVNDAKQHISETHWAQSGAIDTRYGEEDTLKVIITISPKSTGVELNKDSYDLTYSVDCNLMYRYKEGSMRIKEDVGESEVSKDNVNDVLNKLSRTATFTIDHEAHLDGTSFE